MYSARNIHYELSDRMRGIDDGGIGGMHRLAHCTGLIEEIDRRVMVLKRHLPYHESDHVLGIAYNILCGGTCLQDIELRRNNEVHLDAVGAQRIPDPTTAGDFCRRFSEHDIESLMAAINETRLRVWRQRQLHDSIVVTVTKGGLHFIPAEDRNTVRIKIMNTTQRPLAWDQFRMAQQVFHDIAGRVLEALADQELAVSFFNFWRRGTGIILRLSASELGKMSTE